MILPLNKDILPGGINQDELYTWMANVTEVLGNLKNGNAILSNPGLSHGSNADDLATVAFSYQIGGAVYSKAAVAAGTALGTTQIPQATYGAVALDIGVNGTLDPVEAPANATGYASAAAAAAALPAPEAAHARVGWVTITKSDGAFTLGTTALNAANVTTVYTAGPTPATLSDGVVKLTQG